MSDVTEFAFDEYDPKNYSLEVTAWPTDPDTHTALQRYIRERSHGNSVGFAAPMMSFAGANLVGMDLSEAYLFGANLDSVVIARVDLNRAVLSGVSMKRADLSGSYMHKVEAVEIYGPHVNLSRSNLFRADLVGAELFGANLVDAQLSSTNLGSCNLETADMRGCQFGPSRTYLSDARMAGVLIEGAIGEIVGPVFVDDGRLLDGEELQAWFAARGAPDMKVSTR
ncbi:pentapeptide repeat-containing protein [Nocardia sp. NPDC058519]|uniref:pentapeptide repeat-containing protein n=1 Tax=Nocardia sp. NPDC058519 TaxID=3346535 RepID=UPI0036597E79